LEAEEMRIELDKIAVGRFKLREKLNEEHLNDIMSSFRRDGQWDPIIVRPAKERGFYELIAGEYRVEAAKKLGWKDIEATVKDLDDITADFLALKTNLIRQNMSPLEEGMAVRKYMTDHQLTQEGIAKELGRSEAWVSERLALALSISQEVREALVHGRITLSQAVIISQLSPKEGKLTPYYVNQQGLFLKILLDRQEKGKLSEEETRRVLKYFQNDTIYTIGYAGLGFKEFRKKLEENEIKVLVDVRESGESRFKPEFNEEILKSSFEGSNIIYERRPDLGVIYEVRQPYIDGYFSIECFRQWYNWWVRERTVKGEKQDVLADLVKYLKEVGRPCLMCEEAYPKPKGSQKHHCHRDILADMILGFENKEEPLLKFQKRVDL
jgi:ParB family chromosome partitioning protein